MTSEMPIRLLLGPQRPTSNLGSAVAAAGIPDGSIAVISAGWQEAEGDIDDVRALVDRELIEVGLYSRAETLFAADQAFHDAYRARQEQLKELQRLYRLRLRQLMIAARQTLRDDGDPELVRPEQRHAIAQVRALDRHHLHRVQAVHTAFATEYSKLGYAPLTEHAAEIAAIVDDSKAVLITGGNVLVLLNRLLLFGIGDLLRKHNIIAWSAGAMVLADHIVLFHDRTPLGRRDPELMGAGAGVLPGYVFLPDAVRRIRERDKVRAGLFSRRFSPDSCVTLDSGSELRFEDRTLVASESARRLTPRGGFATLHAS